ncbi:putative inorganic carbon transporter subunit DabA, partial [Limnospira sp. PMC 1261.20]|uniref:putative inorganic carbon transporter subunit DabA n=1 Tax=Limnospira sp. PMC 1261.20 TaxID=2981059 RepID=UPI0037BFB4B6
MPAQGITLPDDTLFLAGLHDTTTDKVAVFPDSPAPDTTKTSNTITGGRWLTSSVGLTPHSTRLIPPSPLGTTTPLAP